jgi:uncharacterized membrane protein (UPF0127 family)
MKFNFYNNSKRYGVNVDLCDNIFSRTLGLMFKKNSKPLLFLFNKFTKEPIHSLFCVPFIAIWFNNDQIIDIKLVKPYKLLIKPKLQYNKLLEIPRNSAFYKEFCRRNRNL